VKEESLKRPEVKEFVKFMLTEGGALVAEVGYLPLPDKAYELAWRHVETGKLGSVFGGVPEVGVTIDDLLAREGKL
jgi:phosphate transport system substrate-binding protein